MDASAAADSLARGGQVVASLLDGLDEEAARWRPGPRRWSLLEVGCHLLDEEREDFRVRLEHTLRGSADWPPIDPEGWVRARRYAEQDPAGVLAALRAERARSVAWLTGLAAPDWSRSVEHPTLGTLSAGDLVTSWIDHDLIHARQMLAIQHGLLARRSRPYEADYAGGRWPD